MNRFINVISSTAIFTIGIFSFRFVINTASLNPSTEPNTSFKYATTNLIIAGFGPAEIKLAKVDGISRGYIVVSETANDILLAVKETKTFM